MKLKIAAFNNIISKHITRKEFVLLATCLRCCNSAGYAEGISYRDAIDFMSVQCFYDCLRTLQDKHIISYTEGKQDYNVTVNNCSFLKKEDFKEGYINLNDPIFSDEKFWELRVNEQLLLIDLYRMIAASGSGKTIGRERFYAKYMKMFQCTSRTIKKYIHSIKRFLKFVYKQGMYHIYILREQVKPIVKDTIQKTYDRHYAKMCCRRLKKNVSEDIIKDIAILISQYRKKKNNIYESIKDAIQKSIENCNKQVIPQYINKVLSGSGWVENQNREWRWSENKHSNYDFEQLERELRSN